jgi:hypothetical protein
MKWSSLWLDLIHRHHLLTSGKSDYFRPRFLTACVYRSLDLAPDGSFLCLDARRGP